ncbi:MAG: helix-turn-helix domain-containing protein, partial [Hyphomonadaceae bacterium]
MTATHAEPAVRGPNTLDHKIGLKVRSRRLEIGMSQERLAEKLGVTFQQIQKYEKGVNRIAASRLFGVAKALDVPVGFFFPASEADLSPSEFDRMA